MVESIARQSVVIKCNLASSIMTGNYEFYYAAGLLHKLLGIAAKEVPEPFHLETLVLKLLEGYEPKDEREMHLARMLRNYKPQDAFDEQMRELFLMGEQEQHLWQELPKS